MAKGLDANVDCAAHAPCLKEAGVDFVGRYYKFVAGAEPLTRTEALALSQAGLFIVAIYENGFPTRAGYFSMPRASRTESGRMSMPVIRSGSRPERRSTSRSTTTPRRQSWRAGSPSTLGGLHRPSRKRAAVSRSIRSGCMAPAVRAPGC